MHTSWWNRLVTHCGPEKVIELLSCHEVSSHDSNPHAHDCTTTAQTIQKYEYLISAHWSHGVYVLDCLLRCTSDGSCKVFQARDRSKRSCIHAIRGFMMRICTRDCQQVASQNFKARASSQHQRSVAACCQRCNKNTKRLAASNQNKPTEPDGTTSVKLKNQVIAHTDTCARARRGPLPRA